MLSGLQSVQKWRTHTHTHTHTVTLYTIYITDTQTYIDNPTPTTQAKSNTDSSHSTHYTDVLLGSFWTAEELLQEEKAKRDWKSKSTTKVSFTLLVWLVKRLWALPLRDDPVLIPGQLWSSSGFKGALVGIRFLILGLAVISQSGASYRGVGQAAGCYCTEQMDTKSH